MTNPSPPQAPITHQGAIDELYLENIRLRQKANEKTLNPPGSMTGWYVLAVVVLCILDVAGVIGLTLARPEKDNTALIATILGVTGPIIAGLLAAALREVHVAFNSRMTDLLELTQKSAMAEGQLREKAAAFAVASAAPPAAAFAPPTAAASLTNIDQNTAAIEKNTARTTADVQEMKGKG